MSAKHTPGPWQISKKSIDAVVTDAGNYVADCGLSIVIPDDEQRANARLIAAAPDMLEALEEIARLPIARTYPDGPCIEQADMDMVLAAIQKAKGKA